MRRIRFFAAMQVQPVSSNHTAYVGNASGPGPGVFSLGGGGTELCAVVCSESVTGVGAFPGVITAEGENKAITPAGRVEVVSETGFAYVPLDGAIVKLKCAVWPAATLDVFPPVGALTE